MATVTKADLLEQLAAKDNALLEAQAEIFNLLGYMQSKKFRCGNELDGYINISDVHERLKDTVQIISEGYRI